MVAFDIGIAIAGALVFISALFQMPLPGATKLMPQWSAVFWLFCFVILVLHARYELDSKTQPIGRYSLDETWEDW